MDMNTNGDEYSEEETAPKVKGTGLETSNPNAVVQRGIKIKDLAKMQPEQAPMSRKEREEAEKKAAAERYAKKHALGLTEEYKKDMAKLNEVKQRRELAAAKAALKAEEDEQINAASIKAKEKQEKANKAAAKNSDDSGIPKLDKITIKKMKPALLKEALKERKLDIQGNAKALLDRLLAYEEAR